MSYTQTPIADEPIHGADIGGRVWACQVPEQSAVGACFDWRCRGCTIAAIADVLHGCDGLGAMLHQKTGEAGGVASSAPS